MSAIGRQEPPRALARFILTLEAAQVCVPPNVRDALDVLWQGCMPDPKSVRRKPRDRFNRLVGQARRRQPSMFRDLWRWARMGEVKASCCHLGQFNAWFQCRRAFAAIARGVPAHQAFGLNQPGKPHSWRLTRYQRAAFEAERLIRAGATVEAATEQARQAGGLGDGAERGIRRNRHRILWGDARNDKSGD